MGRLGILPLDNVVGGKWGVTTRPCLEASVDARGRRYRQEHLYVRACEPDAEVQPVAIRAFHCHHWRVTYHKRMRGVGGYDSPLVIEHGFVRKSHHRFRRPDVIAHGFIRSRRLGDLLFSDRDDCSFVIISATGSPSRIASIV
jgi:hypothetical protein